MKTNKEKVEIILQYIEDHLDEDLSLDNLARLSAIQNIIYIACCQNCWEYRFISIFKKED